MIAQVRRKSKRFAQKTGAKFSVSAKGRPVRLQKGGAQDGRLGRRQAERLFEEGCQQGRVDVQFLGGGQPEVEADAVPLRPAVEARGVLLQVELPGRALLALLFGRGGGQRVVGLQFLPGRRRVADGIAGKGDEHLAILANIAIALDEYSDEQMEEFFNTTDKEALYTLFTKSND